VNERQDLHFNWCHLVEQAISLNEELPKVGLVEFGDDAFPFRMDVERGGRLDSSAWISRRSAARRESRAA
jgi:hypothetical protein